jgi:CheY-like chemotaxis protein
MKRVMVVEGDGAVGAALLRTLVPRSHLLMVAGSTALALAALKETAVDVVFVDDEMPGIEDFMRDLSGHRLERRPIVVALMGDSDDDAVQRVFTLGCTATLTKSRDASSLLQGMAPQLGLMAG